MNIKIKYLSYYLDILLFSYLDPFVLCRRISEIFRCNKPDPIFRSISNVAVHLYFRFINKHLYTATCIFNIKI